MHAPYAKRRHAGAPSVAPGRQQAVPVTPESGSRADAGSVLAMLDSTEKGLTAPEAARRRKQAGASVPASGTHASPARQLVRAFLRPLPLVLLGLAIMNFLTAQPWGGAMIAVLVVLSTVLSFIQEYRAGQAAARLLAMVHTRTRVLRREADGTRTASIPMSHLAQGDIILLSAGDAVPADVRILQCRDLFIDQSALTGEAMPVEKSAAPCAQLPPARYDLPNIAFMGTSVASGTATAVVIATARDTDFGRMAQSAAAQRELTSFDRGLQRYIALMLRVMVLLMALVFLINGMAKGDWMQALQFAAAVAVGLTPELLPVVFTVNLAKGAVAMAQRKCIVKRLNAIQNTGAMDVLCTDKTGTLTQNRVVVARHVDIDGKDSAQVAQYAYLNSHFQTGLQNLLDRAVQEYIEGHHLAPPLDYRKIDELPFDFQRRRMSVILERPDGTRLLICKGAVEEVAANCTQGNRDGATEALHPHHAAELVRVAASLNQEGFRVIAVAVRELPAQAAAFSDADEHGMLLAGYIAFLDPPKSTALEALQALHGQGIAVKVLTGDNEAVTRHVAHHVGLRDSLLLSGPEIAAMDAATLQQRAVQTTLFVKLTPQQKADVIRALQGAGHVVGYLGDGINDAGALKAADVGISVDTAADIARESADIILLRKSLMAVSEGVREGRQVFVNITKYLRMSASASFGNMVSVLGASILLPFLPMAPLQILLNNLLYDVSQTALASDRVDASALAGPRRWDMSDIGHAMLLLGGVSSLFDYLTYAWLWFGLHATGAQFQTGWFVESLLSQTLAVHVIRTARLPFVQSRASPALLATTMLVCLCGVWLPGSPLAPLFGLQTMPAAYWPGLCAILAGYLLCVEWAKRRLPGPH
ncbi:magnesium-translocating P-type ATPase [Pseudoduganella ginsengisoli]